MEAYLVAVRALRAACLRASSLSRRSSSVSSALIRRAWREISSVAARILARLSSDLGNRTDVCAIELSGGAGGRAVMSRSLRADAKPLRSPVSCEPTPHPALSVVASSRLCCVTALNTTLRLTRRLHGGTLAFSISHPLAGGPAVDESPVNGHGARPRGGRLHPMAMTGYSTLPDRNRRGSPRWPS